MLGDRRGTEFIEQLKRNYRQADLTERERSLLDYAAKLTEQPGRMVEQDLEAMRRAGLGDEAILDANLTAAYYAYVNRIADGLGVPLESHMLKQE